MPRCWRGWHLPDLDGLMFSFDAGVRAFLEDQPPLPLQLFGLTVHQIQLFLMAIQGSLYQQFFPVAFQRPDSFVHVCRECSCRAAIHHFRHGQNVLVIGFDDLPITA